MRTTLKLAGLAVLCLAVSVNLFAEEPVTPVPKKPEPLKLTAGWGTIHGQVLFDGEPIQLPPRVKKGPGIPDPIPDESLLIDPKTGGLANVVVYLRRQPAIHPSLENSQEPVVECLVENMRFFPHIVRVRTDQKLRYRVSDERKYSVNVSAFMNPGFNVFLQQRLDSGQDITIRTPEALPIPIRSDTYSWMQQYAVVLDHPYSAVSDAEGRFTIEGLPAGEHAFIVWHERGGYLNRKWTVTVPDCQSTTLAPITVTREQLKLPAR